MEYSIARKGQQIGSFDLNQVLDGINNGTIYSDDFYWRQGMPAWESVGVFKLKELQGRTPQIRNVVPEIPKTSSDKPRLFKAPFSFNGRIRRLEYGLSYIIGFLWTIFGCFLAAFFVGFMGKSLHWSPQYIQETAATSAYISLIGPLWFIYAQGCKRCHDLDNSGAFQLIPFYIFCMLFADGDSGANQYGLNPKENK
jgi:uncharacterized membrane protein YhaH (DUF805 family)